MSAKDRKEWKLRVAYVGQNRRKPERRQERSKAVKEVLQRSADVGGRKLSTAETEAAPGAARHA